MGSRFLGDFGRQVARDERCAWAQDGELLAGDLELGVAQPLGVVESDRGENGHLRLEDVRRVEAAAEAGLDHAHFNPGVPKRNEGGGRGRLELSHALALFKATLYARHGVRDRSNRAVEGIGVHLGAADADTLRPALRVRR